MDTFAIFGDAHLDSRGFSGNDTVEVRFRACPRCATLAASQSSD